MHYHYATPANKVIIDFFGIQKAIINTREQIVNNKLLQPPTISKPPKPRYLQIIDDFYILCAGNYTPLKTGDAIRIYNYVRLVRDVQCGEPGYLSDLEGDLNADCYIDMLDFARLGQGWQTMYEMSDLVSIAQNWLDCIDPDSPCNYIP